jgi:polyisoprenyl-teichoic acid--peptidoglycan teichoic acid transferase
MNVNPYPPVDPAGDTRPNRIIDPNEHFTPVPVQRKKSRRNWGCLLLLVPIIALVIIYFLAPLRTNILLLGIDDRSQDGTLGRSDTNIIVSIEPLRPTVSMLSIPRDLWVTIPGVGENRINTAHFFAEIEQPGSGPKATLETVRLNFGLTVPYYARVRFDSFQFIVEAMGGVTLDLDRPMGGYGAGRHDLNGVQALAFARDRAGTDDFFRMEQGQVLMKAAFAQMLNPLYYPRLPAVAVAIMDSLETNVPVWLWPRLGLALVRAGPGGIDNRTLTREMITPWLTPGGAQVLLPNWESINPLLSEMFGR